VKRRESILYRYKSLHTRQVFHGNDGNNQSQNSHNTKPHRRK
jgi:hypothetical protein